MPPAERADTIDDVRRALREMLAAQRRMRGREAQRPEAISFSQHAVLRVLADGDEHSAGELAVAADLTPASITKMLDGLSRAGLLERVRDESDRRRVGVRITDAGRSEFAAKEQRIRAAWDDELAGASEEAVDAMILALRRVASLFDAF